MRAGACAGQHERPARPVPARGLQCTAASRGKSEGPAAVRNKEAAGVYGQCDAVRRGAADGLGSDVWILGARPGAGQAPPHQSKQGAATGACRHSWTKFK